MEAILTAVIPVVIIGVICAAVLVIAAKVMAQVEESKRRSAQLWQEAEKALDSFGERAWFLRAFAEQLKGRKM